MTYQYKNILEMEKLKLNFFERDTQAVAKELLGKVVVRKWRGVILAARIREVESYVGENDMACHAAKGKTKRNAMMFGEAARAYVYLIYGMYYCLNVVTESKGFPAAVLIRGVRPMTATLIEQGVKLNGPGKLCRAMHISRAQNGENLATSDKLFIADDGLAVSPADIFQTPRIGVDYAGADALLPWRYFLK